MCRIDVFFLLKLIKKSDVIHYQDRVFQCDWKIEKRMWKNV